MKKTILASALSAALLGSGGASATAIEDELAAIRARLNALEKQVLVQNEVIREKDRQIQALSEDPSIRHKPQYNTWVDRVEIGGVVEVEASHTSSDGDDESDVVTPTVELSVAAQLNDWVAAEMTLLYEEDTDNNGDLNVDTAFITIADPNGDWFVNGGILFVPFGVFDTNMISDPLTLDLGETSDSAIQAGMVFGPVTGSIYSFQGDRDAKIQNYGAALDLALEGETLNFSSRLAYINDIGESDGLFEAIDGGVGFSSDDDVPGWSASARVDIGDFMFIAEYVAALDGFEDAADDEPSAYNLEAGIGFELAGRPATFALAYQGSDGYEDIDPGISERRIGGTLAVEIFDGTSVALEYRNDEDYNGDDADTVTGQVAVEF